MCEAKKTNYSYQYLRILACFMVLVNHTVGNIFYYYGTELSKGLVLSDFVFNCCRMNVVTFIFISGALLLGKEESYKDWFIKRIVKYLLIILLFSSIYYPWQTGTLLDYLRSVFSINLTNAYWYLYLYICIMALLPALRAFVKGADKKAYWTLFVLFGCAQCIYPILVHYFDFPYLSGVISAILSYWSGWIVIFLLGYYCKKYVAIKYTVRKLVFLFVIWLIGNAIPTILTVYQFTVQQDNSSIFCDNPFLIWSLAASISLIFLIDGIVQLLGNRIAHLNKCVSYIAGLTLGIYLLGDKLIGTLPLVPVSNSILINTLVSDVYAFLIGAVITFLLKKIPIINKLL